MHVIRSIAAFAMLCAFTASLSAQGTGSRFQGASVDSGAEKLDVGQPKQDLSGLGYVLAPGVIFAPTGTVETGYNSNPDELFADAEGSLYGLANTSSVLGFIKSTGATTLTMRGTFLQYDGDVTDSSRWDAGLALDNAYAIAPNTQATFGIYYLRDEISLVASDNQGGYGQLAFREDGFETFMRLRADQVDYLGSFSDSSLNAEELALRQPSQFNLKRLEGVSGFIFGPQARIGVYAELGGANLDYYDQGAEDILDRDTSEIWAITGFRFNLRPDLTIDAGWRLNVRQVEDKTVDDQTTNFFDGRLIWTPKETLRIVGEVDRKFAEPSSTLAVMTDRIHYGASVFYKIRSDVELSAALRHDQKEQIGDDFDYHETEVSLSMAYQWSEKTTLYGLALHETIEEQSTGQTADKFQIGGGTRIKF